MRDQHRSNQTPSAIEFTRLQENVMKTTKSGNATVWAQERLTIDVGGSGHVNYYGHPTIIQSNANVRQLDR
jgi:hypothetical protein